MSKSEPNIVNLDKIMPSKNGWIYALVLKHDQTISPVWSEYDKLMLGNDKCIFI